MTNFNREKMIENSVRRLADSSALKEFQNSTGFKVDIDTLTGIKAKVTEQKFYEVRPSDFMPVVVGENAWADDLLTYRSFQTGDAFESGLVEAGSNSARMSTGNVQIEGVRIPVKHWANEANYNLMELAQASRSGNWSLVEAKESARFKNWQLGIQKAAFLGLGSDSNMLGLLTQTEVTSNTAAITKDISSMTATEFQAFLAEVLGAYFENSNSTAMPDTFVIPTDDYLGLGTAVDETYNMKSRLQRIQESMAQLTQNPDFKVLPLAYAQQERNADFNNTNRYVLYRRNDDTSLRMDIPVDYTTTVTDTINGFNYNSVAYGSFSSAFAFRPAEMLYFDYTNA